MPNTCHALLRALTLQSEATSAESRMVSPHFSGLHCSLQDPSKHKVGGGLLGVIWEEANKTRAATHRQVLKAPWGSRTVATEGFFQRPELSRKGYTFLPMTSSAWINSSNALRHQLAECRAPRQWAYFNNNHILHLQSTFRFIMYFKSIRSGESQVRSDWLDPNPVFMTFLPFSHCRVSMMTAATTCCEDNTG